MADYNSPGYSPEAEDDDDDLDIESIDDAAALFDQQLGVAIRILQIYPFRLNGQYDKGTEELVTTAQEVVMRFLKVEMKPPGVVPGQGP